MCRTTAVRQFLILAAIMGISYSAHAQRYIQADPFYLMLYERAYFLSGEDHGSLLIRPLFKPNHDPDGHWTLSVRSELFSNNNAPNLENMSVRWVGKGRSFFSSFNISYTGRFVAFSLEPFYFKSQNKDTPELLPISKYAQLNDNRPHTDSPYLISGVRESQIYLHYHGIGVGISNANMWWGPGIHSTLNMTNNTTGFRHVMVGTLRDQRVGDFSFNTRYIFAELDSLNPTEPYFSALVFATTLHSHPILTVGLSRSYLSGGKNDCNDNDECEKITRKKAVLLPFKNPFAESRQTDPDNPGSAQDRYDQILSGYISASFPRSGLKVFVEYGRNDHAWDRRRNPSRKTGYTSASIVGLRKYGLFGNRNMVFGIEYANLMRSRYTIGGGVWGVRLYKWQQGATWYDWWEYDYSRYDGRRWGAHSGSDSDDFTIYLGYLGEKFTIIPSFNYERHGVMDNNWMKRIYLVHDPETGEWVVSYKWVQVPLLTTHRNRWPEVKFEFRLDLRLVYKGFRLNLYYEKEYVDNLRFQGKERRSKVIWLGVERHFEWTTPPLLRRNP